MAASLFGIGAGDEDLAAIRALRSNPPGMAGDGKRGKTFGASLEQFEQLLRAGRQSAPASAPILLFYALAQAGRAVLAAHAPQPWEVHGHGLRVAIEGEEIGATRISPAGEGLFQSVATAINSDPLTEPVTLTETWARIPHLPRSPDFAVDAPVIFAIDKTIGAQRIVRDEFGSLLVSAEDFTSRQHAYPELAGTVVNIRQENEYKVISLDFAGEDAATTFDASLWTYLDQPYLRVSRGRGREPSGLMLWWILLQALSQFARYEPARWTSALRPDGSTLAVPLEQALQRAAAVLPRLVGEALKPAN